MKNKFIKYVSIIIGAVALSTISCTDMEEEVYDKVIYEQIDVTKLDPISLVGPCYLELRELMWRWNGLYETQEDGTDELITPFRVSGAWGDGDNIFQKYHQHKWTPQNGFHGNLWGHCTKGITLCNEKIANMESGTLKMGTETDIWIAELKCLRALFYYVLCDNFGRAPIYTKVIEAGSSEIPPINTRQEVYDFVIKELTENADKVSSNVGGKFYGRINKDVVYTILAKMYLNAEVYTGTAQWQKCIDACDMVINSGNYILEPDYRNPFKVHNELSKENIFAIAFTDEDGTWENWHGFFYLQFKTLHPANKATYNMGDIPWNGICGIPQFIQTYNALDKRLGYTWVSGQQYAADGVTELTCTENDKYKKKPLIFYNSISNLMGAFQNEGLRIGKFEVEMGTKNRCAENDWPFFRYADILMMKAEALLRSGKADDAALIVTQVRMRAFDNAADATVTGADLLGETAYKYGIWKKGSKQTDPGTVANPDNVSDIQFGRFLDELGWEFVSEAHRRQDLVRFGVYTKKSWCFHSPNGDFRNVYPIPYTVTLTNGYEQNTGYQN